MNSPRVEIVTRRVLNACKTLGIPKPTRTLLSLDGTYVIEWNNDDAMLQAEIDEDGTVEWALLREDEDPQHWTTVID